MKNSLFFVIFFCCTSFAHDICKICRGELDDDDIITLCCMDKFHKACMDKYLLSADIYSCPHCNKYTEVHEGMTEEDHSDCTGIGMLSLANRVVRDPLHSILTAPRSITPYQLGGLVTGIVANSYFRPKDEDENKKFSETLRLYDEKVDGLTEEQKADYKWGACLAIREESEKAVRMKRAYHQLQEERTQHQLQSNIFLACCVSLIGILVFLLIYGIE